MVIQQREKVRDAVPGAAIACGVLGILGAAAMYWLVVPGVVLGLAAVVLGWIARRREHREVGSVAMTLGVIAVLLVPAFNTTADEAERWGRDCALHPEADPNC